MGESRVLNAIAESCPFDALLVRDMKRAVNDLLQLNLKRFRVPQQQLAKYSALDVVKQLEDLTSPVGSFIRDCCVLGPTHRVAVDDLFARWAEWCVKTGRPTAGTVQMFGRDLSAVVPEVRLTRPREDGSRYRAYEGIQLVGGDPWQV